MVIYMAYWYSFLGIMFIFIMNSIGAALIYLVRNGISKRVLVSLFGFSGGIMLASAIFSLLIEAISLGSIYEVIAGFVLGAFFLEIIDLKERKNTKSKMLIAITVHNIPEGLAVGIAFGAYLITRSNELLFIAISVSLGIGIQNSVEGFATSMSVYGLDSNRNKAFMSSFLSGAVEPFAALIGIILTSFISNILPFFLAFASGAMIYVVISEIVPEITDNKYQRLGIWGFVLGFCIMMFFDVFF